MAKSVKKQKLYVHVYFNKSWIEGYLLALTCFSGRTTTFVEVKHQIQQCVRSACAPLTLHKVEVRVPRINSYPSTKYKVSTSMPWGVAAPPGANLRLLKKAADTAVLGYLFGTLLGGVKEVYRGKR